MADQICVTQVRGGYIAGVTFSKGAKGTHQGEHIRTSGQRLSISMDRVEIQFVPGNEIGKTLEGNETNLTKKRVLPIRNDPYSLLGHSPELVFPGNGQHA